jgi:hypothetical protein
MQRIIGYECFLENTFRALCEQLNVPSKLVLKYNNQFISDAMNATPIGEFLCLTSIPQSIFYGSTFRGLLWPCC